MRRELIGDLRASVRARQHVAAGDVDLVGQRQRDGVARLGGLDLAVGDQKARDRALAAGIGGDDAIASRDASARDRAGEAAKIQMRAVDPLHGQAKGRVSAILLDLDALEIVEQMRARSTRACARLSDETLSPWRAEIGSAINERKPSVSANFR